MSDRKQTENERTKGAAEAATVLIESAIATLDEAEDRETYTQVCGSIEDDLTAQFTNTEDGFSHEAQVRGLARLTVTALMYAQQSGVKYENHMLDKHGHERPSAVAYDPDDDVHTRGTLADGTPFVAVGNNELPYPDMEPEDLIRWLQAGRPKEWAPGQGA